MNTKYVYIACNNVVCLQLCVFVFTFGLDGESLE